MKVVVKVSCSGVGVFYILFYFIFGGGKVVLF